jgi:hypothetical protein
VLTGRTEQEQLGIIRSWSGALPLLLVRAIPSAFGTQAPMLMLISSCGHMLHALLLQRTSGVHMRSTSLPLCPSACTQPCPASLSALMLRSNSNRGAGRGGSGRRGRGQGQGGPFTQGRRCAINVQSTLCSQAWRR